MEVLPNGVAVCGSSHHAEWCRNGLVHDPWFAGQISKHLKPGDVVIEGGAHIGTLTRAMLDAGAQVLAFEPNPDAAMCLLHNCPGVVVFQIGLSSGMDGEAELKICDNAGMSYLVKGKGVPLTAIDRFRSIKIRLIKLDIEGMECGALEGARETIAAYRPVLIIEVNRSALERNGDSEDKLLSLIESLGYRWAILQPQCRRGDEQYDIEAIPISL